MNGLDALLVAPTLTAHFADQSGAPRGHGFGEWLAQIKIAADAFLVEAIEEEHGFGVIEVDGVFDLSTPGDTIGRVVGEIRF